MHYKVFDFIGEYCTLRLKTRTVQFTALFNSLKVVNGNVKIVKGMDHYIIT